MVIYNFRLETQSTRLFDATAKNPRGKTFEKNTEENPSGKKTFEKNTVENRRGKELI